MERKITRGYEVTPVKRLYSYPIEREYCSHCFPEGEVTYERGRWEWEDGYYSEFKTCPQCGGSVEVKRHTP